MAVKNSFDQSAKPAPKKKKEEEIVDSDNYN